jgi:hypothetical protein
LLKTALKGMPKDVLVDPLKEFLWDLLKAFIKDSL